MKLLSGTNTIVGSLVLLTFTGCAVSVPETKVYTLSTWSPEKSERPELTQSVTLGVGPMEFPDKLKRPQILVRRSDNRLSISELHHWAGNLEAEFLNTLVRNLVDQLGTATVYAYPWDNRRRPQLQVQLSVYQFDGKLGQASTLSANWALVADAGKTVVAQRLTELSETAESEEHDAMIAAQSRLIGELAAEIAEEVRRHTNE